MREERIKVWRLNTVNGPGGLVVDDPFDLGHELDMIDEQDGPLYIFIESKTREEFEGLTKQNVSIMDAE